MQACACRGHAHAEAGSCARLHGSRDGRGQRERRAVSQLVERREEAISKHRQRRMLQQRVGRPRIVLLACMPCPPFTSLGPLWDSAP